MCGAGLSAWAVKGGLAFWLALRRAPCKHCFLFLAALLPLLHSLCVASRLPRPPPAYCLLLNARCRSPAVTRYCRAEQRAAQEAKVLKTAGLAPPSAHGDDNDEENIRASYR